MFHPFNRNSVINQRPGKFSLYVRIYRIGEILSNVVVVSDKKVPASNFLVSRDFPVCCLYVLAGSSYSPHRHAFQVNPGVKPGVFNHVTIFFLGGGITLMMWKSKISQKTVCIKYGVKGLYDL